MKKILAILTLLLGYTGAYAQSATVEYSAAEGLNGKPGAAGYLVKWTTPMNRQVDWDLQMTTAQADLSNSVSTRVEVGLVPKYDLGWARFTTKLAVGTRMNSSGDSNYYVIQPGLAIPLNDRFGLRLAYRFRESFESSVADTTRTARLGVNYNLSTKDSLGVRYDRVRGDSNQNSWNFSYTRRF